MRFTAAFSLFALALAGCADSAPTTPPKALIVISAEPEMPVDPQAPDAPDVVEPEAPVEPDVFLEPEPFSEPEAPAEPEPPLDTDGDGLLDADDNCPEFPNRNQIDRDDDGIGDVCDACVGRDEICDGEDNDCDGASDEGVTNACGACGRTPDEACDGVDNDCDGAIDEGFDLDVECTAGAGACAAAGRTACAEDRESIVCAAVTGDPAPETCDAIDNDCDGRTDEGFEVGTACIAGVGQCGQWGRVICGPDGDAICDATPRQPTPETCERQDNDCDGRIDEGVSNACGTCGRVPDEVCDGADNDCDGQTDEGVTNACGACGIVPDEICGDALDNDCDGEVDEGFDVGGPCSIGEGECRVLGRLLCTGDGEMVCDGQPSQPEVERCDGRDNDCDGETDEDARDANTCGVCGPQPVESCSGEDDDCDGLIDEGFDVGAECEGGLGESCRRPGVIECGADGRAVCEVPLSDLRACHAELKGKLAVGQNFSCVALFNGVKCFGVLPFDRVNGVNQVNGVGPDLPYVDLGMQVERISAGDGMVCAHDILGRVKCAGDNNFGQLGLGRRQGNLDDWALDDRPFIDLGMQVEEVAVGVNSACARGRAGVKCWGRNDDDRFGLGHDELVGDEPQDMGAALPYVSLGFTATALAVGASSQCAIGHAADAPQGVKCWGHNYFGQLGVAEAIDQLGDEPAEMGEALPYVGLGMAPAAIAAGLSRTCALGRDGQVKCWGLPAYEGAARGLIGLDEPLDLGIRAIAIASSRRVACAVGSQGELVCWGKDFLVDETRPPHRVHLGMRVIDVVVSDSHGCALGSLGAVKCWGENGASQLGQGDGRDRDGRQPIEPIELF